MTIRKTCFHINKRKCRKLYYFRRKRTINDADVLKFHLDNLDFQNNQSRNNFYSLNIFQCLRMNETKPSSGGHYRSKETVLVICFVRQCNYLDLDGDWWCQHWASLHSTVLLEVNLGLTTSGSGAQLYTASGAEFSINKTFPHIILFLNFGCSFFISPNKLQKNPYIPNSYPPCCCCRHDREYYCGCGL